MDNRRRKLGPLKIELRPSALVGPYYEFSIEVTVDGRRAYAQQYVMGLDEMRSRFDQMFDTAKEMLEREINGT